VTTARLFHGDNVAIMDGLAAGSFAAAVTDPPYGLGPEPPPADVLRAWLAGDDYCPSTSGGFMDADWDAFVPGPRTWEAVYRVLQPGGLLIAAGAPRTYDWLGIAIRLAGFEVHDSIHWTFGQGRPSSKGRLKPSHEPFILARKPGPGSLKLAIDPCRVSAPGEEIITHGRSESAGASKGAYGAFKAAHTGQRPGQELGRWPPNVVMGHAPGCRQVGATVVAGDKRAGQARGDRGGYRIAADNGSRKPVGPTRGAEVVPTWECAEGCPVATLAAQSGPAGASAPVKGTEPSAPMGEGACYSAANRVPGAFHGDKGTATRFYPQFQLGPDDWAGLPDWAANFMYQAKAATSERDAGLLGVIPCRVCGGLDTSHHEVTGRKVRCRRNTWPAVKPLGLMRWLLRLTGGGSVIDPFAGTGTTLAAGLLEGVDTVGIESADAAFNLAKARIEHWAAVRGS